ncbi:MAG: hypothetical protein HWE10_09080 [Gammaproteobacteria bacterium]|nr:hypothetical protein [Gammaproteobacteria bacterium]
MLYNRLFRLSLAGFTSIYFTFFSSISVQAAPWNTEDYYLCFNQTTWGSGFGSFAIACDVQPWGQPNFVIDNFSSIMYDHSSQSGERARFMNELYSVLKATTRYYIETRKPDVTDAEVEAWQLANFAKAHQESFWTHYRYSQSGLVQMLRGDSGHGHGLVQIDDRWHFTKIEEGAGWHIFKNITYGMEIFYSEWQSAAGASCVDSETSWLQRSRAAYSAYNGGPTKVCRWTDPTDVWAQNDQGYLEKIQNAAWLTHITDETVVTEIDITCFMEEQRGCSAAEGMVEVDSDNPENWPNREIILESGESCLLVNGGLECVENSKDLLCLNLQYGVSKGDVFPSSSVSDNYQKTIHEPLACYREASPDLAFTGEAMKFVGKVNGFAATTPYIYDRIGGSTTGSQITWGKPYQVLDVVINGLSDDNPGQVYYKVKDTYSQGYILVGDFDQLDTNTELVDVNSLSKEYVSIARTDDEVTVLSAAGIALTAEPTSNVAITTVPYETKLDVLSTRLIGNDIEIYYQVEYAGQQGVIYGGKVLNGNTQNNWAAIELLTSGDQVTTIINTAFKPDGTSDTDNSQNQVIPANSVILVLEKVLKFKGEEHELWDYKVEFNDQIGTLFGGFTKPSKADSVFTESNALHPDLIGFSRYYQNRMTFTEGDTDLDDDGMPNEWELTYGLNILDASDAAIDIDQDGATNLQEFAGVTSPLNPDTDNDGVLDGNDGEFTPSGTVAFATTDAQVNENDGTLSLTLARTDSLVGEITVAVDSVDDTAVLNQDFTLAESSVTFLDGESQKLITLNIIDNDGYSGDRKFTVNLTIPAGSGATLGANSTVTVTIIEDEEQPADNGQSGGNDDAGSDEPVDQDDDSGSESSGGSVSLLSLLLLGLVRWFHFQTRQSV